MLTLKVSIPPADPEMFPYALDCLSVEFTIPEEYPQQLPKIAVTNADLPERLRASMAQRIEARLKLAYSGKAAIWGLYLTPFGTQSLCRHFSVDSK